MEGLPAETLLSLLRIYETAIAELRAMGDARLERLITRLTRHRGEVVAALAARGR